MYFYPFSYKKVEKKYPPLKPLVKLLWLGPVTSCTGSSPRLWDNKHIFFENINHTYRCVFDDDFAKDDNGGEFNMLLSI